VSALANAACGKAQRPFGVVAHRSARLREGLLMRHGGAERPIRANQIDLAALDRGRAAFVNDIDPIS
jgi:hypothetical protein